jgi:hypothetical protein
MTAPTKATNTVGKSPTPAQSSQNTYRIIS